MTAPRSIIESVWSVEPSFATQLFDAIRQGPNGLDRMSTVNVVNRDGVAIIEARGVLTKYPSYLQSLFGGAATTDLHDAFKAATLDPYVTAICLLIDSPGGAANGIPALADAIHEARGKGKPVAVQIDGVLASAAYYFASQADKVYASHRSDRAGSIGTMLVIEDSSKAAEKAGVEMFVASSGELKSIGAPGVPLTDAQKTYLQSTVDAMQADFSAAVQRGRKLTPEQVQAVADGRVLTAPDAINAGLIDGIQSLETTLAELQGSKKPLVKVGGKRMASASYAEIKAECVGATPEFIVQCQEAGLEPQQCRANWFAKLTQQTAADATKVAELTAKVAELEAQQVANQTKIEALTKTPVVPPGGAKVAEGAETVSAVQQFREGVNKLVSAGVSRQIAVSQFVRANPEINAAMLAETKGV